MEYCVVVNSDLHNYLVPAIIVTGGSVGTSVEALRSDGSSWCSLPTLPDVRSEHTQADGVLVLADTFYTLEIRG